MLSRLCLIALLMGGFFACTKKPSDPPSARRGFTSTGRSVPATVSATPEGVRLDGSFKCEEVSLGTGKYSAIATGGPIVTTTPSDVHIQVRFEVESGGQTKESSVGYVLTPGRKLTQLNLSGASPEGSLLAFNNPIDRCQIEISRP